MTWKKIWDEKLAEKRRAHREELDPIDEELICALLEEGHFENKEGALCKD